jgi:hypothetical protein
MEERVSEMADDNRIDSSAGSFEAFLKQVNKRDKRERKIEEDNARDEILAEAAKALANCQDWMSNADLIESNFKEAQALFCRIGKSVTSWSRTMNDYKWEQNGETFYSAGLRKIDEFNDAKSAKLTVDLRGIKDVRLEMPGEVDQEKLRALEGYSLAESLKYRKVLTRTTERWVQNLGQKSLEFRLFNGANLDPAISRDVDIGYLYSRNLADTCKDIFIMMNSDDIPYALWESKLKIIIPEGDYSIRRGNLVAGVDDNIIPHTDDPMWKNE